MLCSLRSVTIGHREGYMRMGPACEEEAVVLLKTRSDGEQHGICLEHASSGLLRPYLGLGRVVQLSLAGFAEEEDG